MTPPEEARRAPAAWIDALARSRADIAAGRVSDIEPFLRELEAEDAAELNAEQKSPVAGRSAQGR